MKTNKFLFLFVAMIVATTLQAQTDFTVSSIADDATGSIAGTLRHAILELNKGNGGTITIDPELASDTIRLVADLPAITSPFTIEGNGIILYGVDEFVAIQIPEGVAGTIRRVHFTKTKGVLNNDGEATLQSCIFSENTVAGCLGSSNILTIQGCTFYGNYAPNGGGAIWLGSKANATITGSIFYDNTGANGNIVSNFDNATVISGGYNLYNTSSDGFDFGTDDIDITGAESPMDLVTFEPFNNGAAMGVLPATLPVDYPTVDFNGKPIVGGGQAGAIQHLVSSIGSEYVGGSSLFATVTSGALLIKGLLPGEEFRIYTVQGQLCHSATATSTEQTVYLRDRGLYIVATKEQAVKVKY